MIADSSSTVVTLLISLVTNHKTYRNIMVMRREMKKKMLNNSTDKIIFTYIHIKISKVFLKKEKTSSIYPIAI